MPYPGMKPVLTDLIRVFASIGLMSFGGPAAQIAVMHKELVEDRNWLTEDQFLRALSFCMLLPGPEAMQLCTYSGWRLRGTLGGLIAGLLFVLPGAVVMLGLALAYARWSTLPFAEALFLGIKATVVIVVIQALRRLAGKTLKHPMHWLIAIFSFIALYVFDAPFPIVIAVAAVIGLTMTDGQLIHETHPSNLTSPTARPPLSDTIANTVGWLALWWAPIGAAYLAGATVLTQIGVFFSKLAVVSFGGAYAVLAYMAQEAVSTYNWLSPAQMMDGLGLAETTPGPLILVTEFVGFLAGFGAGGTALAIFAALMTLWVTFVPCFLWIFVAAPHVEWITARPRLTAALAAIAAAVVGVIANLSLWFALHVVFDATHRPSGVISPTLPQLSSLNSIAVGLSLLAALLLVRFRLQLPLVLVLTAAAGAVAASLHA